MCGMHQRFISTVLFIVLANTQAHAAELFAYPAAGQSPEQQKQDKYECHQWAVTQTGYDPTNPPAAPDFAYTSPPPGGSDGGMVRGAARGAAAGAIGGAIAGDAGEGAAIGAATGALFGTLKRRDRRREEEAWKEQQAAQAQQQQHQYQQQIQEQEANYNRAFTVCMTSRDYQVQ